MPVESFSGRHMVVARALRVLTDAEENGMYSWQIDETLKRLWESHLASESAIVAGRALVIIDEFPNSEKMPIF